MNEVFVVVEGVMHTFHTVAINLLKAQRFVQVTFPTAQQIDDLTYQLPNGVYIYILETEIL